MERLRQLASRFFSLFRRGHLEAEMNEEMQTHLEMLRQENIKNGMPPEVARRAALRSFGGVEQAKEAYRDQRGLPFLETFLQDVRYSLRQLRRSPGFTAVAVLTLAIGIGANTAIFSLMNAVMLRRLAVREPGRLVLLGTGRFRGSSNEIADTDVYSFHFYRELRQKNQVFSETSAVLSMLFERMHGAVGGSDHLEEMNVQLVSGTYFPMLGVKPVLGRTFTEADDEPPGAHPVAMAGYSWWTRRFARDPSIVGKTVTFGSTVYTIIGVTPPEFFGTEVGESPDLWIPLSMEKQVSPAWNGLDDKWFESLYILGRLKPGVTGAQAEANVNLVARQVWRGFAAPVLTPDQDQQLQHAHIALTPAGRGLSQLRFEFSLPLQILMVIVGLVLLIACANVANLMLARAAARRREIAVRMVMGSGRRRLIRQMLTESLLLAFCGGAAGVLVAFWASQALLAKVSTGGHSLPISVTPDARVLAFTFLISLLTAVLFGAAPALRATQIDVAPALKEGKGRATVAHRSRLGGTLIVLQVAVSLVLLIGAGLFLRTLVNLTHIDTGFNKENVLIFSIDPVDAGYKEDSRLVNLYRQIEQKVNGLPGVRAASVAFTSFNQGGAGGPVVVVGSRPRPENNHVVTHNFVGPGYFATMGIPLLLGRVFGPQDAEDSPKVAVINETMARWYFPGESAVGRRFGLGTDVRQAKDIEVVGVVKDAKYQSLVEKPWPAAYYPYVQGAGYCNDLQVRYAGDRRAVIDEVRRAVGEVDRRLPVSYQNTLAEQVDGSLSSQALIAELSSWFGVLAAFLSCIGIYGLMAYSVARRTNEIGIRMALGAAQGDVVRMVVSQGFKLTLIGVGIGIAGALALTRYVSSLLYGVKPTDSLTFVAVSLSLLGVALFASYIPARRATRVDPMIALRYE